MKTKCMDCGRLNPGWFWVKPTVWSEAGFRTPNNGIICLKCFSKRPMTIDDFNPDGPCSNDALMFMYAMGQVQFMVSYATHQAKQNLK